MSPDQNGNALWKFPNVFDLGDAQGYCQQVCVPRQAGALKRMIYGQLHRKPRDGKAGEALQPGEESRAGDAAGKPPAGPRAAYPAGKRLAPVDAKASLQHARKNFSGHPLCWDNSCWAGCSKGAACPHEHDPIPGLTKLHWTVVAQVLRRGGLKNAGWVGATPPREVAAPRPNFGDPGGVPSQRILGGSFRSRRPDGTSVESLGRPRAQ